MQMTIKPEKRYPIQVGHPSAYRITLVGCGGTGSFLALHLARLAYHVKDRLDVDVHFVDFDIVEARNIGRQNFAPAEIGRHKAQTLARRYSLAFGLRIKTTNKPFSEELLKVSSHNFNLLIGCVDNHAARRAISATVGAALGRLWWLDCGNHEHAGQILLGNRPDLEAPEIALDFCGALPSPGRQHPELLEPAPVPEAASCAELLAADAQSLMINQAMATYAAQYVYRLVLTKDLDIYATYVDLLSGSARSRGIISREISPG